MKYFDKYPNNFRIIILILCSVCIFLISFNSYRVITSITTGTYFQSLPSQVNTRKVIPARKISDVKTDSNNKAITGIPIGSFIMEINGIKITDLKKFQEIYYNLQDFDNIFFYVKNFTYNEKDVYSVKKIDIPDSSFLFLSQGMLIDMITEASAADRAGIKPGDILISINGHAVGNDYSALKYLRKQNPGQIIPYEIIRNGRTMSINVRLAFFGLNSIFLISLLSGLLTFGTGLYLIIKRPELIAARLTGMALLLIGFKIAVGMKLNPFGFDFLTSTTIITEGLGICLGLPLFFHSMFYFPPAKKYLIEKKWLIISSYVIGILSFFYLLIKIINGKIFEMSFDFSIIFIATLFIYQFIIWLMGYKKRTKAEKKISRPIIIALNLNLILFFTESVVSYHFINSFSSFYFNLFNLFILPTVLIPLSYLFVIGRYKIFDLNIRMRKNIQYITVSALWKLALTVAFIYLIVQMVSHNTELPNLYFTGTSIEFGESEFNEPLSYFYKNILLVFIAIIIYILFVRLNKLASNFLDKIFFRKRSDYNRITSKLSELLDSCCMEDLTSSLVNNLSELAQIKKIGLVIIKKEISVWSEDYTGFNQNNKLQKIISENLHEVIQHLYKFTGAIRISQLSGKFYKILSEETIRLVVPIKSRGKLIGSFFLGEKLSELPYNINDLEFITTIAAQTAVAIENGFLYEDLSQQERIKHELQLARNIQMASLPQSVPSIKGLDISGITVPAFEVGGDFYDFLNGKKDELTVIVGDVSGKGASAALYMSKAQGIMRTLNEFDLSPKELLVRANRLLYGQLSKNSFITTIAARINTDLKTVIVSRAGHLPLLHYDSYKKIINRIVPKGITLGVSLGDVFTENLDELSFTYNPGDIFLFISDGVIEAQNENRELFGEERLISLFREFAEKTNANSILSGFRDSLLQNINDFSGGASQFDDITIVVIKSTLN